MISSIATEPRLLPPKENVEESGMKPFFVFVDNEPTPSQRQLISCLDGRVITSRNEIENMESILTYSEDDLLGYELEPVGNKNIMVALLDGNGDWLARLSCERLNLLRRNLQACDLVFVHDLRSIMQVQIISSTPVYWLGLPANPNADLSSLQPGEKKPGRDILVLSPRQNEDGAKLIATLSQSFPSCRFRYISTPEEIPSAIKNAACALVLDNTIRFGFEILALAENSLPVIGSPTLTAMYLLYGELALHPLLETAALKDRICDCLYSPARVCWIMEQTRVRLINTCSGGAVKSRFFKAIHNFTEKTAPELQIDHQER